MALNIIQIAKINSKVFKFKNAKTVNYPVAPLVSTNFIPQKDGSTILKIRATLYINTETDDAPYVGEPTVEENILTLYYNCSFSDLTPRTCDIWYVEVDYISENTKNITKILTYLKNTNPFEPDSDNVFYPDPPVSRGTQTDTTA